MTDLVFVRRRIAAGFEALSRMILSDKVCVVSDERIGSDALWWGQHDRDLGELDIAAISESDTAEIIRRCRLLRQLERQKALSMIGLAIKRWSHILSRYNVRRVLTLPIDSYVLDVLYQICRLRGIKAYSIVGTPFSNRLRFTCYGELNGEIDVDATVVRTFISDSRHGDVTPDWLIGAGVAPVRLAGGRLLVDSCKPALFGIYRLAFNDANSFSFASRRYLARRMFATPERFLAALYTNRRASMKLPQEFVFLPLQFYPESTSDYWVREPEMHDHHATILAIARGLSGKVAMVFKEHPAAFGRRDAEFINSLSSIKGVYFVPYQFPVSTLINRATLIVGQGSTTTLQSIVAGKSVVFAGRPYFCNDADPICVLDSLNRDAIDRMIFGDLRAQIIPVMESENIVTRFVAATAPAGYGGYKPLLERRAKKMKAEAFASDEFRGLYSSLASCVTHD